jgi:SAM-dependent methyltransferase
MRQTAEPNFARRSPILEKMDDPTVRQEELLAGLDGLARVNALTGGHVPSLSGVRRLGGHRERLSVLDVGTGSGDTARRLVDWARAESIDLYVRGIDRNLATVDHARRRCVAYPEVEVALEDLFHLREEDSFDVVHAALLLHHLTDDQAIEGMRAMYAASRLGVVFNDLHRHRIAYYGSRMLLPLLSTSEMVRHDGPISVLRGFVHQELVDLVARAGLPRPQIRWWPLFRWQVVIGREDL